MVLTSNGFIRRSASLVKCSSNSGPTDFLRQVLLRKQFPLKFLDKRKVVIQNFPILKLVLGLKSIVGFVFGGVYPLPSPQDSGP